MKMELVQKELQGWGEIIIVTAAGQKYELHLGDTEFDFEDRVIRLKSVRSRYIIDGDSVESIELHLGGEED